MNLSCATKKYNKHSKELKHLLRQFDDPRWRNDDVSVNSHQARLLDLLHHETADLIVVGRLAPRTADRNDLLYTRRATSVTTENDKYKKPSCR